MEPEGSRALHNNECVDINPEAKNWFDTVDTNRSGRISNAELQAALVTSQGKSFSEETCRLLIKLFDKSKSGTIGIKEFQHLYVYIKQWMEVFRAYDKDNSGYIEEAELLEALNQMGYKLSTSFVKVLFERDKSYTNTGMSLDEFIVNCVKIQRLTDAFRNRDKDLKGTISIGYEDFLHVILEDLL